MNNCLYRSALLVSLALLLLAGTPCAIHAAVSGAASAGVLPEELRTPLSRGLHLASTSPNGAFPLLLRGELSDPIRRDVEAGARTFIVKNRAWFPCFAADDQVTLTTVRDLPVGGRHHLSFQPTIKGLPIYGQSIDIHVSPTGIIDFVTANLTSGRETPRVGTMPKQAAIQAAEATLGVICLRGTSLASQVLFPNGEFLVQAWLVEVRASDPLGDFEVILEARTGRELHRENQMDFAGPVVGKGNIYPLNPMHGPPVVAELPYLTGPNPSGLYVRVTCDGGPTASNAGFQHLYDPSSPQFDQINVYSHVNRAHDFYRAMGFSQIDKPVQAKVQNKARPDAAFFSLSENLLAFGGGVKLKNLAQEEAVIYHEYAHCALRRITDLTHGGEAGAINEGQADYFAATLTDDPIIGE